MQQLLQPRHVVQRFFQAGAIFFRLTRPLQQRLQCRLQNRNRRLELVRCVRKKFALLVVANGAGESRFVPLGLN